MPKTLLFLYGTLKRGLRNHHFLSGQEFLGEVESVAQYRLYHLTDHPGIVHDPLNGQAIQGELWSVDEQCLQELDRFEGVPDFFDRLPIAIQHQFETVYAYFFQGELPPNAPSSDHWPFEI